MKKRIFILTGILFSLLSIQAIAVQDQPPTYNRINISAQASQEVNSDVLVVTLYTEEEDKRASRAANKVNQTIQWALDKTKAHNAIKVETLNYQSNPVYNKQQLKSWRVRQSIRMESSSSTELSELTGELQDKLLVQNISYHLSPDTLSSTQDSLIIDAIQRFKQRATNVSSELGHRQYKLVSMNINTSGNNVSPYRQMRAMSMEKASVQAPALEPGTLKVNVNISGTIELN